MPKCEKTNECEVILSWRKDDETIRTPIRLLPENYIAFDMYRKIKRVSGNDFMEKKTTKGTMTIVLPKITQMYDVLDRYAPDDFDDSEIERLINKIMIIHVKTVNNALSG